MPDRTVLINVITRTAGAKRGVNDLAVSAGKLDKGAAAATASVKKMNPQVTAANRGLSALAPGLAGTGIAAGPAAAGVIAVGAAVKGSVGAFASFESEMTKSLAIMGDVSDTMRGEMSDAARELATQTTFSASEAAESYFFLASAGLDAQQSVSALPTVAAFAQAGMFDMALATDLLTDAQSSLGLTVDDATQNMFNMTRVSDVFVKANTLANTSVQQVSEAITNKLGGSLRAYNIDLEEGVAVLAAYADQGLKGAAAGESLNIVLRDLKRAASENAGAFADAGISVFDARGNFRSMADIIADLEGAFGGLSVEQQTYLASQLGFQDRSFKNIQLLIGQSDAVREYERSLRDAAGTTEQVAGKQLESFAAQMDLVKSELVDLGISVGQELAPAILDAAKAFGTLFAVIKPLAPAIKRLFDLTTVAQAAKVVKFVRVAFDDTVRSAHHLERAVETVKESLAGSRGPVGAYEDGMRMLLDAGTLTGEAIGELGRAAGATETDIQQAMISTLAYARATGASTAEVRLLEDALYAQIRAGGESATIQQDLIVRHGLHAQANHDAADAVIIAAGRAKEGLGVIADAHGDVTAAAGEQLTAEQELAGFYAEQINPAIKAGRALERVAEREQELADLRADGKTDTDEYRLAVLDYAAAVADADSAVADFKTGDLTDQLFAIGLKAGESRNEVLDLLEALGLLDGTQVEANVIIKTPGQRAAHRPELTATERLYGLRARGGPVAAGRPYMVGEAGPEMFVPSAAGRIVPNHRLTSGGQTNVERNLYVTFNDPRLAGDPVEGIRAAFARDRIANVA